MMFRRIPVFTVLIVIGLCGFTFTTAQGQSTPVDELSQEVIDHALSAAEQVVQRNTDIHPLPEGALEEKIRELRQLRQEHNAKIMQLESELHSKLDETGAEFRHEASKEDKPEKINEKRAKLKQKVADAYAQFEEKITEENVRYDEKREHILDD